MSRIKKLSLQEAQKIAAGQVVERPANVVKELVENSIDAQATQITVYIERAGKQLMRIVDNGCGMDADDALLCFGHHTTSKISTIDDLNNLQTFGFRGEALSSISGVSMVTLITKDSASNYATVVELEGGVVTAQKEGSATVGTDISIKNLFYNVPARKKFLRSDDTEWRQIQLLFQAFCFDYPQIHFKLLNDGQTVYTCPPVAAAIERVAQLWGVAVASNMIALVPQEKTDIKISGFISTYQHVRYDRSQIFLFVNRRWIRSNAVSKALLKGYLNVLPPDRYPVAAIFIELESAAVDINIHPRKEEVLFMHPRRVETAVQELVKKTLENSLTARIKNNDIKNDEQRYQQHRADTGMSFDFDTQPFATYDSVASAAVEQTFVKPFLQPVKNNEQNDTYSFSSAAPFVHSVPADTQEKVFHHSQTVNQVVVDDVFHSYTIVGQYHKTYILLEQSDGLFLVDQHAAHERILYEQFLQRFELVESIALLFPEIIELTRDAFTMIEPQLSLLQECGIGIEPFADQKLVVRSAPVSVKNISFSELVHTVVGWLHEYKELDSVLLRKTMHEKLHAQMACKAAVKAGDVLSHSQMESLLQQLQKTTNRFSCPHGRPTGWLLSLHEIEKKFKRKL